MKHLKSCSQVNINRVTAKENRTCEICNKTFAKKSNRDRHIQSVHRNDNVDDNDVDDDLIIEDEDFPSMAFNNLSNAMSPPPPAALPVPSTAIVTVPPSNAMSAPPVSPTATITAPPSAPPATLSVPSTAILSNEMFTPTPDVRCSICAIDRHHHRAISHPDEPSSSAFAEQTLDDSIPSGPVTSPLLFSKKSRLESFINKIATNIDYENKFSSCVMSHLKKKLKENRREAVSYMRECFGTLLDDQHFLKWLSKAVDYKLYRLKNLVSSKPRSNRKSYSVPQQEVYDFWVQNSITSNDSTNSSKCVSKMSFFRDFKEITDDIVQNIHSIHAL